MKDKKVRISRNKLHAGLWTLLGAFVILIMVFYKVISGFEDNMLLYALIALGIAVVVAIAVAIIIKEEYFRLLEDGFEITKGKKTTKYTFADFAGSKVTRHYYNGIYTGTTRELKIMMNGKPETINANRLSKDDFAELVSSLGESEFLESHDMAVTADYFDSEKSLAVPKESIVKANKANRTLWTIVVSLLCLAAIVLFIMYFAGKDSAAVLVFAILFAAATVIWGVMNLLPSILNYKKIQTLPERVSFYSDTVVIGKQSFKAEEVTSVSMVPDSYNIMNRDMIILTKDGGKYKFNFGVPNKSKKMTFKEYDQLYMMMKMWCITNKISFMSILG